ncbi:MAG: hypothetical protein JNL39_02760 [Opitutaceae bacterium]|nr:hypothetical protein [Opitutaceae bacterium]
MNHREPPHPTAGVRKATLCLATLLLPVLAPTGAQAARRPASDPNAYLPAIAAPALRFHSGALPREQVAKLIFPKPAPKPSTEIPQATPKPSDAAARPVKAAVDEPKDAANAEPAAPKAANPSIRPPQKILTDDTRPAVQPEDFIQFFQLPAAARGAPGVNVVVPAPRSAPAPAPIPESSATFRQTP